MAEKQRYTVSLPKHVTAEIERRAKVVDATPTEYAADIIRWWFGQGCPPVTHDETHLRGATTAAHITADMKRKMAPPPPNLNAWELTPDAAYSIIDDNVVRPLMAQLGVPNLFSHMQEHDEAHTFVPFDNHPTHWIVLHLWKGHPEAHGNGLLFEAIPKRSTSREEMLAKLQRDASEMGAGPVRFSQLPSATDKHRLQPAVPANR